MMLPFENNVKALHYFLLWIIYAVLHILSFGQIIAVPFWVVAVDGIIHAGIFSIIGILLWSIIRYGNYNALPMFQRFINYSALAVLSISLWTGIGYFLDYIVFPEVFAVQFISFLVLKGFIGLMIFLIIILSSHNILLKTAEREEYLPCVAAFGTERKKVPAATEQEEEVLERVAVKIGSKIHVIHIQEIFYFQSYGDYVQIITEKEKYIKEQTMKYFETHLPADQFVRIHRSYIINVESISRIELHVKQTQLITLKNGDQLKVSASGYKMLRAALNL